MSTTPPMTGAEADENSQRRAKLNQVKLYVLAGFFFLGALLGAGLLQHQTDQLGQLVQDNRSMIRESCEQRRINVIRSNKTWEALAAIERRNKFIDEDIRQARLKVYENAMLVEPDCTL